MVGYPPDPPSSNLAGGVRVLGEVVGGRGPMSHPNRHQSPIDHLSLLNCVKRKMRGDRLGATSTGPIPLR